MGFMNPAGARNFRLTYQADAEETGVFNLHNVNQFMGSSGVNTTVATGRAVHDIFQAGQAYIALFRNPLRNAVMFIPNPTNLVYTYAAWFYVPGTGPTSISSISEQFPLRNSSTDVEPINPITLIASTTFKPHGNNLFCGEMVNQNLRFIWLDIGAQVTFVQSTAIADAIAVYMFETDVVSLPNDITWLSGSTTTNWASPESGYYAFEYHHLASHSGLSLSMTVSGSGDVSGHLSPPGLWYRSQEIGAARTNATSLLVSNHASIMNVEGTIYAAELPGNQYWPQYTTPTQLENCLDYKTMKLSEGMYTWARPGGADAEHYTDFGTDQAYPSKLTFPLLSTQKFVVFLGVTSANGETYPGLNLVATIYTTLEVKSNSQYYEHRYADHDLASTQRILHQVSRLPLDMVILENPTHLASIAHFLSRGVSHLKKNAGAIGAALGMLFPGSAAPLGAIGGIISGM